MRSRDSSALLERGYSPVDELDLRIRKRRLRLLRRRRTRSHAAGDGGFAGTGEDGDKKSQMPTGGSTTGARSCSIPVRGEIRMLHPFSAVETTAPRRGRRRAVFANCAWDALVDPGRPARRRFDPLGVPRLRESARARGPRRPCSRAAADLLVHFRRPSPALVGRHRLHLKHNGLPPVGGAPGSLADGNAGAVGA